mgnify:CR=1 FL=1
MNGSSITFALLVSFPLSEIHQLCGKLDVLTLRILNEETVLFLSRIKRNFITPFKRGTIPLFIGDRSNRLDGSTNTRFGIPVLDGSRWGVSSHNLRVNPLHPATWCHSILHQL